MQIVHVFASRSWGGAEIYAVELAARQREHGLSSSVWGLEGSPLVVEARKRGVPVHTEPISIRLDVPALPRLGRYIRANGITHLHLHWSGGVWAFFGLGAWTGVKLIYHNHMWISHYKYDPFHLVAYAQLRALIVAGSRARASAAKHLAVSQKKLKIVPYGIDLTRRSKHTADPSKFVFGLFARIDRQKGTKEFLLASERALEGSNAEVVLVGDPTLNETDAKAYSEEVDALIAASKHRDRIRRMGSRKDYLDVLATCDVLVVPSYHESYSLLILDAFMQGKPVIATNSGGTPDLVTEERGWLVPPRDVDALAITMKLACRDREAARSKGEAARVYVEREHSFDFVLSRLREIYEL
ncbi:MAG TPA: glycosyltransferase family 4 protein [Bdellovibrionales bacterium]|nr:glycosyltransferase family 4 protein [Bdellovibrionales bacterium]